MPNWEVRVELPKAPEGEGLFTYLLSARNLRLATVKVLADLRANEKVKRRWLDDVILRVQATKRKLDMPVTGIAGRVLKLKY